MLIVPAIDIRGGKCVRLVQGDYARETVFSEDPAAMARRWIGEGARALHLVDLDGAKQGSVANRAAVEAIVSAVRDAAERPVLVELGGGIRDVDACGRWLDAGLDRVILGTIAVRDPDVVSAAAKRFPGRIWVGLDARDGKVAVAGWTEATVLEAVPFARDMERRGAAGIIYTDIERDGTGRGVNAEATAALARAVDIPVVASGGVASTKDVERLVARGSDRDHRIAGVVVGRALYDGSVTLAELLRAAGAGA